MELNTFILYRIKSIQNNVFLNTIQNHKVCFIILVKLKHLKCIVIIFPKILTAHSSIFGSLVIF